MNDAKIVNLIVAKSDNNVIGQGLDLPWSIKEDMEHFKSTTINSTVILGRKTFDSIGRPLPKRQNIVVTSREIANVETAKTLKDAISLANHNIFIIGGAQIYKLALETDIVDVMYITSVHKELEITTDTILFPKYDEDKWVQIGELCNRYLTESGVTITIKKMLRKTSIQKYKGI